jgi:exodeoxyribonuclease III
MLRIASWNVNSLTVRLPQVLELFDLGQVDIIALQETKVIDAKFPVEDFLQQGLYVVYTGEKAYNGVAIVSRYPLLDLQYSLYSQEQRRFIAATVVLDDFKLRIVNVYVPNGQSLDSDKYLYKLSWLKDLHQKLEQELAKHPKLVLLGDFNIAPHDVDVHDSNIWQDCVLVSAAERAALQALLALGMFDSLRLFTDDNKQFSWWDYRAMSFRRNLGLRIDLLLVSKDLASLCKSSKILLEPRKHERPSDHAPVVIEVEHIPAN